MLKIFGCTDNDIFKTILATYADPTSDPELHCHTQNGRGGGSRMHISYQKHDDRLLYII